MSKLTWNGMRSQTLQKVTLRKIMEYRYYDGCKRRKQQTWKYIVEIGVLN